MIDQIILVLELILCASPGYAALDHWVGGARLYRGKKNAQASEDYDQNDGTVGYKTWYWDKRFVPYILICLYNLAWAYVICGYNFEAPVKALIVTGIYYWFRSRSPRDTFRAADGATRAERVKGMLNGALLGAIGLSPVVIRIIDSPYLLFTVLLGVPLGLYHWFFRGKPLFRSYGELCQGGLVYSPFVIANLYW